MKPESRKIIIVDRKLSDAEEADLIESTLDLHILQKDFVSVDSVLSKKAILVSPPDVDLLEKHIQRVIEFGHRELLNGKSVAEHLKNGEGSNWYYLRFSLFQRSRNTFILAEIIRSIAKQYEEINQIYLYSNLSKVGELIDIPIEVERTNSMKEGVSFNYLFSYAILFFIRSFYGLLKNLLSSKKGSKMIIANLYLVQNVIDLETNKIKKGDPHLQSVIDHSLKEKDFVYLTQLRPPSLESNHKLKVSHFLKRREFSGRSIYFESFLLKAFFSISFRKRKEEIKQQFKEIRIGSKDDQLSLEDRFLLSQLGNLEKTLKMAIWRESAADRLFANHKMDSVLCIDEHSLQNRSILAAAKRRGTKSIALQHGAISRVNIAYRYTQKDQPYHPYPDLTLIRGRYNQMALIDNFYPEGSLSIVGHPRTDSIPFLLKRAESTKIVYATQPMPPADLKLKRQQLSDFLELSRSFPELEFVIKPHPNESMIKTYRDLSESKAYPNLKVYEGELYQLLAEATIVITYYSTVGLEAIYFNKELVTLDYEDLDMQGYQREGIAHRAKDGKDLIEICRKILDQDAKIPAKKRNAFIENRTYKIDGKATERVLTQLKNF